MKHQTDKTTRILTLYHRLLNGQHIDKPSFSAEHGINERSFDRDIEDIRLFLSEIYSCSEVLFDRNTGSYYLTGDKPKYIDRMDAAIISKILLSSSAFRYDEMDGLLDTILSTVSPHDAQAITKYLNHDKRTYQSKNDSAILKILGDLYATLRNGNDVELMINISGDRAERIIVSPLEIEFSNSNFYLVAAENRNLSTVSKFPVSQIMSFRVLSSVYAGTLADKYCKLKEEIENGN